MKVMSGRTILYDARAGIMAILNVLNVHVRKVRERCLSKTRLCSLYFSHAMACIYFEYKRPPRHSHCDSQLSRPRVVPEGSYSSRHSLPLQVTMLKSVVISIELCFVRAGACLVRSHVLLEWDEALIVLAAAQV